MKIGKLEDRAKRCGKLSPAVGRKIVAFRIFFRVGQKFLISVVIQMGLAIDPVRHIEPKARKSDDFI